MSRAYREMIERFPHLYGIEDDRVRWEQEQMQWEREQWMKDQQAQMEYESWDDELDMGDRS